MGKLAVVTPVLPLLLPPLPFARRYTGIEPSRSMVDMASALLDDFPGVRFEASIARFLERNAPGVRGNAKAPRGAVVAPTANLSFASFLLGELTSDQARMAATKILFEDLKSSNKDTGRNGEGT